ncbi:WhiB family transcriptional regulator [Streptomyces sp. NPDC023723]|uniref:WhiB family transcriptional regulator n=1 Tax=Streptomyces sp. NPDC023723 TaxID=3154323 RepID=UPI0033C5D846
MVRTARYGNGSVSPAAPERSRAACADEDPELFFPRSKSGADLLQEEEAKAVCRRCPLLLPCLRGALERNELGVWGATNEDERRRMKRRAARKRTA